MFNESTIILAVIGMVGLFATATVFQRANRLSSRYYAKKVVKQPEQFSEVHND